MATITRAVTYQVKVNQIEINAQGTPTVQWALTDEVGAAIRAERFTVGEAAEVPDAVQEAISLLRSWAQQGADDHAQEILVKQDAEIAAQRERDKEGGGE